MTAAGSSAFVGREREIAQIGAALEGAAAGRGQLLTLAGEPGIGKTSVADRASAAAAERGFTVLWGRYWEAGGAPAEPYLIQEGFLIRTPRGRQITKRAYDHLGVPAPTRGPQGSLF